MTEPKYYRVEIAMPLDNSPDLNDRSSRERENNPAWQDIHRRDWGQPAPITENGPGWASAVILQDFDVFLKYRDLPDRRVIDLKTARTDQIDAIRDLPGVTVTDVEPSHKYLIGGVYASIDEMQEMSRLRREESKEAGEAHRLQLIEHFDKVVYPSIQQRIRAAVAQFDPAAKFKEVDNKVARAFFLESRCKPLIDAILAIDNVTLDECAPSETDEEFWSVYDAWSQNKFRPSDPAPAP